jgi:hypothetical protein
MREFADILDNLPPTQAITLGEYPDELGEYVPLTTKAKLFGGQDAIARTLKYFSYKAGREGLALVDFDTGGLPDGVRERLQSLGGIIGALKSLMPLDEIGYCRRSSTSAGIFNKITQKEMTFSGGSHTYIRISDVADSERLLGTLHEKAWLNGLGWFTISKAGTLLERSIIDWSVASPERIVFEASPILDHPNLGQHPRLCEVHEGAALDSAKKVPNISQQDRVVLNSLIRTAREAIGPERLRIANLYKTEVISKNQNKGLSYEDAKKLAENLQEHVLSSDFLLVFADPFFG